MRVQIPLCKSERKLSLQRWWENGVVFIKSEVSSAVGDRPTAMSSLKKPLGENVNSTPVSEVPEFKFQAWQTLSNLFPSSLTAGKLLFNLASEQAVPRNLFLNKQMGFKAYIYLTVNL